MRFKNREEAGRLLASALAKYRGQEVVVYGIPRGGVVIAVEVAKSVGVPMDLVIPRKVGHPMNEEYALCVVGEDSNFICNQEEVSKVDKDWFDQKVKEEQEEARRRRQVYVGGREKPDVKGKTAIIVDDGVATGMTFLFAIQQVKRWGPKNIIAAVPVAPVDTLERIKKEVSEVVALEKPVLFAGAVGAYYDDFPQVEDPEVIELMRQVLEVKV